MRLGGALSVALVVQAVVLTGCGYSPIFSFPVEEGDIAEGRQAFIDHQCTQCHTVAGVSLPRATGAGAPLLELGGATAEAKSFDELVTSILNPNHAISERYRQQQLLEADVPVDSPMPMPNIDTMTVRQLIDIVAFLDSRYVLMDDYASGF